MGSINTIVHHIVTGNVSTGSGGGVESPYRSDAESRTLKPKEHHCDGFSLCKHGLPVDAFGGKVSCKQQGGYGRLLGFLSFLMVVSCSWCYWLNMHRKTELLLPVRSLFPRVPHDPPGSQRAQACPLKV